MRELIYKTKWRLHHPCAFEKYAWLLESERLSLDELLARQEAARQKIVRTAMTKTAFYPKFYGSVGFEVGDIGKDGWFERLPLVTKKELREHRDEFVNEEKRGTLRWFTTGGSTGEPVKTGFDESLCEEVYNWRLLNRFGVHPRDNHAYLWRDLHPSKKAKLFNAALWWPTRHLKCDVSTLDDEGIEVFLEKCRRIKPTLIYGYVGALTQVADYVLRHAGDNMSCRDGRGRPPGAPQSSINVVSLDHDCGADGVRALPWRPKFVWSTSAPLSAVQRRLIETAFGAPVCDEYGSCECRWIASQCPECKGLHVNVEHVHLEFLGDDGLEVEKGTHGRTVLTNLEDEAFPLIRYENNDRGRWLTEPCACGRTLPCIDSVKGRESESFVLPSGKVISGEYLTTIFDAIPDCVRGFRITQHKDASITIEYIPSSTSTSNLNLIRDAVASFAGKLDDEIPVDFKQVASIPQDRGKLRFVVRET